MDDTCGGYNQPHGAKMRRRHGYRVGAITSGGLGGLGRTPKPHCRRVLKWKFGGRVPTKDGLRFGVGHAVWSRTCNAAGAPPSVQRRRNKTSRQKDYKERLRAWEREGTWSLVALYTAKRHKIVPLRPWHSPTPPNNNPCSHTTSEAIRFAAFRHCGIRSVLWLLQKSSTKPETATAAQGGTGRGRGWEWPL